MHLSTAEDRPASSCAALRAVAAALACWLLVSCSAPAARGPEPSPAAGRSATTKPIQHPSASASRADGQPVPRTDDAAEFALFLDDAGAVVANKQSSAAAVRKAAESQQLAVRALADSPGPFRRNVITRLDPQTAMITQGAVDAARSLQRIHVPAPARPRWRIIAPPPPAELLRYYREAQRRTGVNWSYLAAIHLVETRMGRIQGLSPSGARGPMQFVPSTWASYGAGGNINNPRDAILAAARLLRANGAPHDMHGALLHYNPTGAYAQAITDYARTMRQSRSAYLGYWNWRVLYQYGQSTCVLPIGYPKKRAIPLDPRTTGQPIRPRGRDG